MFCVPLKLANLCEAPSQSETVMKHKLAIIGLGIMGRRMLENAVLHPEFEVTGVWDPSPDAIPKHALCCRTLPLLKAVTSSLS